MPNVSITICDPPQWQSTKTGKYTEQPRNVEQGNKGKRSNDYDTKQQETRELKKK